MASPFKFFRKYSGGMMIVMVILSMLLFTLTDLFSDPGSNLWLLGLLLGGTVFAIAGAGQGRWLQWGLGGAVLGVVLGLILPEFVQNDGLLNTSLGVITEEQMQDLHIRRRIANQFVVGATEASFGPGTGRFATLFGYGDGGNRDVLFGKLLRAEADELGIEIDPRMVGDYLKRITSDKLTADDYVNVRNQMSYNGRELTDATLQEILSEEIKARMAYQMLRTRSSTLPPGPEVYWKYYRRLNVRQQVVTAELDVDDFLDQVAEPTDGEVEALFTEFKTKLPNQIEPGSPGFRRRFRAKLAYVELNTKTLEAGLPEVTDEDIQKFYDEKKETPMIRTPVLPDFPKSEVDDKADEPKPDADSKPKADPAPEKKAGTEKESATEEKPAAEEKKAESKPAEKPKAEAKAEAKKEPAKKEPAKEEPAKEEPAKEEPAKEKPAKEKPARVEKPAEEPTDGEATEPETETNTPTPQEAPEGDVGAEDKPAATPAASLTIPDVPAGDVADETKPPEIKYEYRELDDELKQEIRDELTRQRVAALVEDKLQSARKTMETLASERASHRFALIEQDSARYSYDNPNQQAALKELRKSIQSFNADLDAKLKAFAAKNGFSYVETPLLNGDDLYTSEEYLIGKATEPVANPMMATQSPSVASVVYRSFSGEEQNDDAQLYFVRVAERASASQDGSTSHYVYWATDFSLSHVPKLEDEGVRDEVVLAWKRRAAREILETRGEALAKIVREAAAKEGDDRQDMTAALADETVNGKDDGPALAVRRSRPFTWLRTSSAAPNSFQRPQASLSQITFDDSIGGSLEQVGDDFMKVIFGEMDDEEVGVVPNFDFTKYYLVQVTNRFPTPEIGEDALRERFAAEGQKFAFQDSPILGVMQQQLDGPAGIEWESSLWKKYGINLNEEQEEE